MAGADHDMIHGSCGGMMGRKYSPPASNGTGITNMDMHHMTFFRGESAEILFSGWPGTSTRMYIPALIVVFFLSVLVEWFSHSLEIKSSSNDVVAGLLQTLMHAIRVGLAYILMLAVMSFNAGVFLIAVAGHSTRFLLFGSRVFRPIDWDAFV